MSAAATSGGRPKIELLHLQEHEIRLDTTWLCGARWSPERVSSSPVRTRSLDGAKRHPGTAAPHFAEFINGAAEGRTRWLNAGYRFSPASPRRAQISASALRRFASKHADRRPPAERRPCPSCPNGAMC